MPTRMQAVSTCNRLNQQRMVHEASDYTIERFWQQASGDFLIAGGLEERRQEALAAKVAQCVRQGDRPIIILSASNTFAGALVSALNGMQVHLVYSAPQFRNYHFFYGMSDTDIASFFRDIAELYGYSGINELHSYILAFLDVLNRHYPPSLPAMVSLARNPDPDIAALGRQHGVSPAYISALERYADAGAAFRNLLTELQNTFSALSDPGTQSELNTITSTVQGNWEYSNNGVCQRIHLVDLSSADAQVINRYMAGEISFLLRKNCDFRLILNGVNLNGSDKLQQVLSHAFASSRCEVGFCSANPCLSGLDSSAMNGFYSRLILLDGSVLDSSSLEVLLRAYGAYEHWEPVHKVKAGFFPNPLADDWDVVHMNRARIRLEDVISRAAVISGLDNGAVATIVKRLRLR